MSSKITNLLEATSLTTTDLLTVVTSVPTTPTNKKITFLNTLSSLENYISKSKTWQIAGDTFKLQAYDVDWTTFVDFITLTANNTPTCDLSSSVTIWWNSILNSSQRWNLSELTSSVLTIWSWTNAVLWSWTTITVSQSTSTTSWYLSSTDWNTFNGKQNALTFWASRELPYTNLTTNWYLYDSAFTRDTVATIWIVLALS